MRLNDINEQMRVIAQQFDARGDAMQCRLLQCDGPLRMMRGKLAAVTPRGDAGALHHFGNHADNAGDIDVARSLPICVAGAIEPHSRNWSPMSTVMRPALADGDFAIPRFPRTLR